MLADESFPLCQKREQVRAPLFFDILLKCRVFLAIQPAIPNFSQSLAGLFDLSEMRSIHKSPFNRVKQCRVICRRQFSASEFARPIFWREWLFQFGRIVLRVQRPPDECERLRAARRAPFRTKLVNGKLRSVVSSRRKFFVSIEFKEATAIAAKCAERDSV
jgi:hypothetical protein